jgi:hypothetical protein
MITQTPDPLADVDALTLRCTRCGYDLRGLGRGRGVGNVTAPRGPECGLAFDPADPPRADIPWLDRSRLGTARAIIQTVWLVLLHPRRLDDLVERFVDVDSHAAQRFRRACSFIATASVAALIELVLQTQAPARDWLDIAIIAAASIPGTLLFCTLGPIPIGLGPFQYVEQRTRFRWLHEFTAAPLALSPLIPLLHVVALRMTTPERALYFSLAGVAILLLLWLWCILGYQAQAIGAKLQWTLQRMITIVCFWFLLGWFAFAMVKVVISMFAAAD